jgi:tetratricopeptide (TPR) repeat protein
MVTNESSINTNMVLPNVTQLYFQGEILQDAITMQPKFEYKLSRQIYDILENPATVNLESELSKQNIKIEDDMVLLEVGRKLTEEKQNDKALLLYEYYTKTFPAMVVAWNDLGDLYQVLNNKDEAIRCYKQALKIRPGNARAKEALEVLKGQKM